MTEELHIRLSQSDAVMIRRLVKRGVFSTVSEAVRFGVKQVLQTRNFASVVEPKLTESEREALEVPLKLQGEAELKPASSMSGVGGLGLDQAGKEIQEAMVILQALRS